MFVLYIYNELKMYELDVEIYDPWADPAEVYNEFGITLIYNPSNDYDGVVLAVAHREFLEVDINDFTLHDGIVYDVKNILPKDEVHSIL